MTWLRPLAEILRAQARALSLPRPVPTSTEAGDDA
jgi:hypothetical protein